MSHAKCLLVLMIFLSPHLCANFLNCKLTDSTGQHTLVQVKHFQATLSEEGFPNDRIIFNRDAAILNEDGNVYQVYATVYKESKNSDLYEVNVALMINGQAKLIKSKHHGDSIDLHIGNWGTVKNIKNGIRLICKPIKKAQTLLDVFK